MEFKYPRIPERTFHFRFIFFKKCSFLKDNIAINDFERNHPFRLANSPLDSGSPPHTLHFVLLNSKLDYYYKRSTLKMGFHGYGGHNSCIIGECSIANCPDGPEIHYHSHESSPCNDSHNHFHPDRTIVPRHRNDGPVDLSQHCTPTGRGTWSIGGQRMSRQGSTHMHMQGTSSGHGTRSQNQLASTLCLNKDINFADDTPPFEEARRYQSSPNVDIPKLTADSKDAKYDRSANDIDRVELEKKAAALLNLVRAMVFPIPVCLEHSHICANVARALSFGNASEFSPSMVSAHRMNSDNKGRDGVYGDTVLPIVKRSPQFSDTSGPNFEGLSTMLDSCSESNDEIQKLRKARFDARG